jgi:hypothetical protein
VKKTLSDSAKSIRQDKISDYQSKIKTIESEIESRKRNEFWSVYSDEYEFLTNELKKSKTELDKLVNSGYTMIVKGLTGDEKNYNGIQFTIRGVRFESISGLSFGSSDNAIQTFTVNCNCIDFSVTSNGLGGTIQNVMGAANTLLG